jgi:hypothetical protein
LRRSARLGSRLVSRFYASLRGNARSLWSSHHRERCAVFLNRGFAVVFHVKNAAEINMRPRQEAGIDGVG